MEMEKYTICVVTFWKDGPDGRKFFGHEIPVEKLVEGFDMLGAIRSKGTAVVEVFDGRSLIFTFQDEAYDFPVDDNVYRTEGVFDKDGYESYLTVEFPLDED